MPRQHKEQTVSAQVSAWMQRQAAACDQERASGQARAASTGKSILCGPPASHVRAALRAPVSCRAAARTTGLQTTSLLDPPFTQARSRGLESGCCTSAERGWGFVSGTAAATTHSKLTARVSTSPYQLCCDALDLSLLCRCWTGLRARAPDGALYVVKWSLTQCSVRGTTANPYVMRQRHRHSPSDYRAKRVRPRQCCSGGCRLGALSTQSRPKTVVRKTAHAPLMLASRACCRA